MNKVTCEDCGQDLEETPNESSEKRKACPNCGSIKRLIHITVRGESSSSGHVTPSAPLVKSSPSLLLQAVLEEGDKTNEGQIILAVTLPWFEIIKLLENDPSVAYQLNPRLWEEIIAGAYVKAGFDEVVLTPASGDHGRDVIAVKKGLGQIRIIDQVKAYKPPNKVTANDVRSLMGILETDHASKGFLTTTSDFAPRLREDPLIKPLIPSRIELINGEMLSQRLKELSEK